MRSGLSQALQQGARQELSLQPRMLQAIEVLQIPTVELAGYLREAFESNPALELVDAGDAHVDAGDAHVDAGDAHVDGGDAYEVARELAPRRGTREDSDRHDEMMQNQPAPERTTGELLLEQLALVDVDEPLLSWVRFLAGCLDDSGYLSLSDEELLERGRAGGLAGGEPELAAAIPLLQSLEPRGIGGRSAVEALILQLDPRDPDYALLCRLLEDFLEDVARNKLPAVARALGVELDHLDELLGALRELDPRPGARIAGDASPALRPEVLVLADGESFAVKLDRSGLPEVKVDADVREVARDPEVDADVRRYLRGQLDQARWICDAVEQRRATLLRVSRAVFGRQLAFLRHGPGHLVPLRMNEVAELLGLHVSTVSRAVAGKDVQTPWGILPLRWFFQAAAGASQDSARVDVREEVGRIVAAEDPAAPLSDDDIAAEMGRRGWRLARRTAAKYRTELGIPSSYRRRRYTG